MQRLTSAAVPCGEVLAGCRRTAITDVTDRILLEQGLRESREHFKSVLENTLDAAYRRNLQTDQYDYYSPVISNIVGFSVSEMSRMKIDEAFSRMHPEDLQLVREVMNQAMEAGRGMVEYRFKCRDGNYRWLADYFTVQKDVQGRPLYLNGIVRNVNERKVLEHELVQNEEEFRSIFELSAVGKAQVDPETGRFVRVNKKFCDITGYAAEELTGMTFSEITHPDDRARDLDAHRRALQWESPEWRSEKRYIRKDGTVIWIKVTGKVRFASDGTPLRSMAVIEDITESRNSEQALRESEEQYRSLVESSPEAIFVQQNAGIVYVNQAGLELLGAGEQDSVHGKNVQDFIHPDFRARIVERMENAHQVGRSSPGLELKILRLDGTDLDGESIVTPIMYAGKHAIQLIVKDITEDKNAELQLRLQATVLSQVSDAVVAVGKNGNIVFWNKGAERLYKIPAEEAIGKQREESTATAG